MPNIALNCDCMEYMKSLPDKAFDLAVVDPPYGDASSQFGNVEREREPGQDTGKARTSNNRTEHGDMPSGGRWNRFGQRFDRYKHNTDNRPPSQFQKEARERDAVARTGGTWAEKYGKKS